MRSRIVTPTTVTVPGHDGIDELHIEVAGQNYTEGAECLFKQQVVVIGVGGLLVRVAN
jgi:hypothetical protein